MTYDFLSKKIGSALLPTPVKKLERISEESGFNITIKRDDLTKFLSGGNKIRKLEYLFYDAKKKNASTVVTCGGIQSNHCRATAVMAREFGFKPVLFLRGEDTSDPEGNLLIDKLLDCEIHWITSEQYKQREAIMDEYKQSSDIPESVYLIPEGGSNAVGALGYMNQFVELSEQIDLDSCNAVFSAAGSGGTMAGLIMGKILTGKKVKIVGINVTKDASSEFVERIYDIIRSSAEMYNLDINVSKNDIHIYDDFVGEAYAVPTEDGIKNIVNLVRKEGILLDPVYTSKAFTGMLEISRSEKYENSIFIHTGGAFANFAYSNFYREYF